MWSHLEGLAHTKPDGEVEPGLGPGKDPGDGPQGVNAASSLPLGRPATNVHAPQLAHWCALAEEVNEARVFPDHITVCVTGHLRDCSQVKSCAKSTLKALLACACMFSTTED